MHKKFKILLYIVTILFTSSLFFLHAEETTSSTETDRETHKASLREKFKGLKEDFINKQKELKENARTKIDELKGQKKERSCEALTTRVSKKIEIAEKRHEMQLTYYGKLNTRLEELITKLTDKGFDVSELESDLVTLNEKVDAYTDAHQNYIDKLKATQDYACGDSEGAFKEAMQAVKDAFEATKTAGQAVHEYFKTEIKEDIKKIRGQKSSEGVE